MPGSLLMPLVLLLVGALLLASGTVGLRRSGARTGVARRLGGARQVAVGELLTLDPLPGRAVRVAGRIRCPDPIVTPNDDRLVALHHDVEVQMPDGGWRTIERVRETRDFELWDHAGALPMDAAEAAEPLIVIPHVWRGPPGELGMEHRAALARLTAEGGDPPVARSVTRMVSVVERLLVLADVRRAPDGGVALVPPPGGYLISAMALDDAMRLLGGSRKGLLLASASAVGLGVVLALVGAVLLAVALLAAV
jgi:hypothetical protein